MPLDKEKLNELHTKLPAIGGLFLGLKLAANEAGWSTGCIAALLERCEATQGDELNEAQILQALEELYLLVAALDIRKISGDKRMYEGAKIASDSEPLIQRYPWDFIIKLNELLFGETECLKMKLASWKKDSNPGLFSSRPVALKEIDSKVVALQRAMNSGNDYVTKVRIEELQNALKEASERKDDFLEIEPPAIRRMAFDMLHHFVNDTVPKFKEIKPTAIDELLLAFSNWPQASFVPSSIRPIAFRKIDKKIKEIEITIKNGDSAKARADVLLLLENVLQLKKTAITQKRRDALGDLEQAINEALPAKDMLLNLLHALSNTTAKQLQQPEFMVDIVGQFKELLNDPVLKPTLKELADVKREFERTHPECKLVLSNAFGAFFKSLVLPNKIITAEKLCISLNDLPPEQKQAEKLWRMFYNSAANNAYKQDERGKNLLKGINLDVFAQDSTKLANLEKGLLAAIDYLNEIAGNIDERDIEKSMEFSILVRFVHCVYGHIFDKNKESDSQVGEQNEAEGAIITSPIKEDPQNASAAKRLIDKGAIKNASSIHSLNEGASSSIAASPQSCFFVSSDAPPKSTQCRDANKGVPKQHHNKSSSTSRGSSGSGSRSSDTLQTTLLLSTQR